MPKIIDLDELLGEDKQVRLGGKVYRLPPDLPVELYLKITHLADNNASELEMTETLSGEILTLFQYGDPTLKTLPLSLKHLVTLVPAVYGQADDEDEAPASPPRKAGTRSSSSKARATRSRQ